jgi:L-gulono-1,4-lactone dehydrogenase
MIENFGRNVSWTPKHHYKPQSETELLEIMDRHRGERIRVVASLHSWSPIALCEGLSLDLGAFDSFRLDPSDQQMTVWSGGGCSIQNLLNKLHARSQWTLPTLGAIKRQTLAGAVSTGTHGSGSPGLSHFVLAARVARYNAQSGQAEIVEISEGDELLALRCGLGCLGLLLEIQIRCRERYLVREELSGFPDLESLLQDLELNPLSFFVLLPYSNQLVSWRRRSLPWRELSLLERLKARIYRLHKYWGTDVALHLVLSVLKHQGLVF